MSDSASSVGAKTNCFDMSRDARKLLFGVFNQVRHKPVKVYEIWIYVIHVNSNRYRMFS